MALSIAAFKPVKAAAWALALLPLCHTLRAAAGAVEPSSFLIERTGFWSMCFLCIALAVTPLRRILAWPALASLRGILGMAAFCYALLHVGIASFDLPDVWQHIVRTPANFVDALAFLLLIPLALTSNAPAKRWLGGQRWKRLHQLVYLIVPLAASRFWLDALTSRRYGYAAGFSLCILILLGLRLYWRFKAASPGTAPPAHNSQSRSSGWRQP